VTAAVILPWSNGQVEGQVHRLKLVGPETVLDEVAHVDFAGPIATFSREHIARPSPPPPKAAARTRAQTVSDKTEAATSARCAEARASPDTARSNLS